MAERDPFGWVPAENPPSRYEPTWLGPNAYLIPMRRGAVLRWVYEETDEETFSLLVRLTEREAQRVFEADDHTGMLEAVRRGLYWRGALVTVTGLDGALTRSWRYIVQGTTTEDEFVRDLLNPPAGVAARIPREQQLSDDRFALPILAAAGVRQ